MNTTATTTTATTLRANCLTGPDREVACHPACHPHAAAGKHPRQALDLTEPFETEYPTMYETPDGGIGLVEQFDVCPAPDLQRRRLALGTRTKRTVCKTGLTVCGVRYHSEMLARWMLKVRNREVKIRWYSEDIGAVAVELDGQWFEVPAVFERFNGVRAQTWLAAQRQLRARFKREAELDENTIFDAVRHIEEINGNAMRRTGLLTDDWSEERIEREEDRLFIGFECRA